MPIETELKLRVESHDALRERLGASGATFLRKVVETNCIFDRLDGMLQRHGCGLRIRSMIDAEGHAQPAMLTFKGPRRVGDLKSREELEVEIQDGAAAALILQRLGFQTVLCYQKRRESWRLGDCQVDLDEPACLGLFAEIEGPTAAAIRAVQQTLGLAGAKPIGISYVGMLLAYCEANHRSDRVLTFS
jgi:predicted adenylyl cyclase CyaB